MIQTSKRVSCDGFTWNLRLPSNIDDELAADRLWEPVTTTWIKEVVRPGMTAVDVGANFGWFTLQLSRLVGPEGKVFAFEPCPDFYQRLLGHLDLNQIENVVASRVALYDKEGEYRYIVQNDGPYRSSAVLQDVPGSGDPETAYCTTLRSYELESCEFIKIDVDGTEYKVLQGAALTIQQFHPTMMVEIVADCRPEETLRLLASWGYQFHPENIRNPCSIPDVLSCFRAGRHSVNLFCETKE